MALPLLITEVTEIHRGTYCVAAWDAAARRMVRPLPDGINWTRAQLHAAGVVPGAMIDVSPNRIRPRGDYPHLTEDLPIDLAPIERLPTSTTDWFGVDAPPLVSTLAEAFAFRLHQTGVWHGRRRGSHVLTGTRVNSLHGVRINSRGLSFVDMDERPRALLRDADACYDLPVTSRALREVWRDQGVAAVRRLLPVDSMLHVRVGLARGWGDNRDRCYVMLNGVLW